MKINKLIILTAIIALLVVTIVSFAAKAEFERDKPSGTTNYHKKPSYTGRSHNRYFIGHPKADHSCRHHNFWIKRPHGGDHRFLMQRRVLPKKRGERRGSPSYGSTYHIHGPEKRPFR